MFFGIGIMSLIHRIVQMKPRSKDLSKFSNLILANTIKTSAKVVYGH